ncbi:MAG: GNAT family N-acetyltransferase [Rhodospirillales bacterium]|nr:GNAT family N-acetyltransferase [Rhodospirillales bacterium]
MNSIRSLRSHEVPNYEAHLLRLDAGDRHLRFGFHTDDVSIHKYIGRIETKRDRILAKVADDGAVVGAVHIAAGTERSVEFAFSVDRAWRGHRLGSLLFEQAIVWARNRGFRKFYIFFLAENAPMAHLTRKAEMSLHCDAGEFEAVADLAPATPLTFFREISAEHYAAYEDSLRRGRQAWAPMLATVLPGIASVAITDQTRAAA